MSVTTNLETMEAKRERIACQAESRPEHASVVLTWGSAGRCCATQTRLPRFSSRHGMGGA
jgi:hypothetical protein